MDQRGRGGETFGYKKGLHQKIIPEDKPKFSKQRIRRWRKATQFDQANRMNQQNHDNSK